MQTLSKLTLASAAAALIAVPAQAQSDRRALSGSSIAIYDLVGHVQVEQGTGNDVVVEVTRGGRDAKKLTIDVGELHGRNTFRVRFPDDDIVYPELGHWSNSDFRINGDGTWGGYDRNDGDRNDRNRDDRDDRDDRSSGSHRIRVKGGGSGTEAWADLKILVPAGKDVIVRVGVGELEATHVTSDLQVTSQSGRLTVRETKGNLIAATGSGGMEVRGATGDDIRIATGSGGIKADEINGKRLRISTGSGGVTAAGLTSEDLDVNSGSGTVRIDDARAPRAHLSTGSGGVRASFASPVKSLEASSGSGGVNVGIPGPVNAEVDIETGSGGIESDFPVQVTRMERHRLRGQIGDGSGNIRIRTGSGSVNLRKM